MSEENTEQVAEVKEATPAATTAEPEGTGEKKKKKINRMTLAEIKSALANNESKMCGTTSHYHKALFERQAELENSSK